MKCGAGLEGARVMSRASDVLLLETGLVAVCALTDRGRWMGMVLLDRRRAVEEGDRPGLRVSCAEVDRMRVWERTKLCTCGDDCHDVCLPVMVDAVSRDEQGEW